MSNPLIILGAGASHGYLEIGPNHPFGYRDVDFEKFQAPLTNDLFDTAKFNSIISSYPEVAKIASEIKSKVSGDVTLEDYLSDIQDRIALANPKRYEQLIALRFYLQKLFKIVNHHFWRPANNYCSLITQIEDNGGKACIVNFNYDLLLEKNLPKIASSDKVDDYIKGEIKVIKIHGACNWVYLADSAESIRPYPDEPYQHFIKFATNFHKRYSENKEETIFVRNNSEDWNFMERVNDEIYYYLPALAIPVKNKADYICPTTHVEELKSVIKTTDRVLIIGWRAGDEYLVELLKEGLAGRGVTILIVSKNSSPKLKEKFDSIPQAKVNAMAIDFNEFVKTKEFYNFF